jgi:hypothetical protein
MLQFAVPAFGQQIKITGVDVSSKAGSKPQTIEFDLKITGEGFPKDKTKLKVVVTPSGDIIGQPAVLDISEGGTTILASFIAPDGYSIQTVAVQPVPPEGGAKTLEGPISSDPYVVTSTGTASGGEIRVYRSLIAPNVVSDIFGKRIGKRFIVLQVTVSNHSKDYQYIIHDISLDVSKISMNQPPGHYEMSSLDLSMLRGVAERGQVFDNRNLVVRLMRASGTIAGGIVGIAKFGPSFAPSVAAFNGPVISAVSEAFPDFTINAMNRLNDSAYSANTLVAKEQSKVMAVFLPEAIFLSNEQQKLFWKEPKCLWGGTPSKVTATSKPGTQKVSGGCGAYASEVKDDDFPDLRKVNILVDGKFITEVGDLVPSLTDAQIDPAERMKFQNDNPVVKGTITGHYLADSSIKLLNDNLPGAGIKIDGTPTDTRLNFIVTSVLPIAPGNVLQIGVVKKQSTQNISLAITYPANPPTIKEINPSCFTQGDTDVPITITGSNFLPGLTRVILVPSEGVSITLAPDAVKSSTKLQATCSVSAQAATGNRDVTIQTSSAPSAKYSVTVKVPKANPAANPEAPAVKQDSPAKSKSPKPKKTG